MRLLFPILAYLIGSISSAVIVSRIFGIPDPRSEGSRNPGATNVLRLGGKKAAAVTLLGDLLKGVIPVLITSLFSTNPNLLAMVGLAAFLGHLYPVFFGFRGGKGVATAFGVLLAIDIGVALILFAIWIVVAALSRYSSLAALVAGVCSPVVIGIVLGHVSYIVMAAAIATFLIWRHRANIIRLRDGTESRISFSK